VFVYEALLEALKAGETTITQSAFRAIYEDHCTLLQDKTETPLQEQFQVTLAYTFKFVIIQFLILSIYIVTLSIYSPV